MELQICCVDPLSKPQWRQNDLKESDVGKGIPVIGKLEDNRDRDLKYFPDGNNLLRETEILE